MNASWASWGVFIRTRFYHLAGFGARIRSPELIGLPSGIVSPVMSAPDLPLAGFAPALVEAVRRANIGVVVATHTAGRFHCKFANECVVSLVGKLPRRVPEDLGFVGDDESNIRAFLESEGPGSLTPQRRSEAPLRPRASMGRAARSV